MEVRGLQDQSTKTSHLYQKKENYRTKKYYNIAITSKEMENEELGEKPNLS